SISSPEDWERVDRLRAQSDAIMVGGHTLLGDDPKLTVKAAGLRDERRARGLDGNPIKVGIISKVEDPPSGPPLHKESHFITAGPARRVIFTTEQTDPSQIGRLHALGVEVYVMGERRVDLAAALERLYELGVNRLLVEGGGTLNAELVSRR